MYKKRFDFLLALFLLTGCTVKESREGAPCTLYENSGDMCPLTVTLWDGGVVSQSVSSDEPATLEFTVDPPGNVTVTAHSAQSSAYKDGIVSLRNGMPVDSVYAYRDTVDCSWEWARDTVWRCKQFATVDLTISINPRHERFPDSLRIVSAWDGVDVRTFGAIAGSYGYTFQCTGTKQSFRVLRQGDDSLILQLIRRGEGVIDNVPLGQLLAKAGYDWWIESLDDIAIDIQEAAIGLRIVILDWNTGEPVVIEI